MAIPLIYVDFQNADPQGRLRLTCAGTINDLARYGLQLREGLQLELYSDDANEAGEDDPLRVAGIVRYSQEEQCWVSEIDWDQIRHTSDDAGGGPAGPALMLGDAVLPVAPPGTEKRS